jgi:hypothetical protein
VTAVTNGVGTGRQLVFDDDDVAADVFSPVAPVDFISVFILLLPEALPLLLAESPAGAPAASGTVPISVPEF